MVGAGGRRNRNRNGTMDENNWKKQYGIDEQLE